MYKVSAFRVFIVPFVENGSSEFRVVHRGGGEDAEGENSQFEIRISKYYCG
jgi:hypothetical protein